MFTLYRRPLPHSTRETRREAEREASLSLIAEAFGPGARLLHHPDGAPQIPEAPAGWVYSLSHSADECILAVGHGFEAIGVDVERERPQLARVRRKFLSEKELEWISEADMPALLRAWTAKEAVYKAARTPGLPLTEIELRSDFGEAVAEGRRYALSYPDEGAGRCVCVAVSLNP